MKEIFLSTKTYCEKSVEIVLGTKVVSLNPSSKMITTSEEKTHRYEKLLLSIGGLPRKLTIPGGDLEGICYHPTLTITFV